MPTIIKSPKFLHRTTNQIDSHHVQLLMQLLNLKSLSYGDNSGYLTNIQKHPQIASLLEWLNDNDSSFKQISQMNTLPCEYMLDKLLTSCHDLDIPLFLSEKQLTMFATNSYNQDELTKFIETNYNNRDTINSQSLIKKTAKIADFYYLSITNDLLAIFNYFTNKKWEKPIMKTQRKEGKIQVIEEKKIEVVNQQFKQHCNNTLENSALNNPENNKQKIEDSQIQNKNLINKSQEQNDQQNDNVKIQQKLPQHQTITYDTGVQTVNKLASDTVIHNQEIDISNISEIKPQYEINKIPYFAIHLHESEFLKSVKQGIYQHINGLNISKHTSQILSKYTGSKSVEEIFMQLDILLPEAVLYFSKNTITWKMLKNQLYKHVQNMEYDYFVIPSVKQFYQIALCCKNDQEFNTEQLIMQTSKQQAETPYKSWSVIVTQGLEEQRNKYINIQQVVVPIPTKNKQVQCSIHQLPAKQNHEQSSQTSQPQIKNKEIQNKQLNNQVQVKQNVPQENKQHIEQNNCLKENTPKSEQQKQEQPVNVESKQQSPQALQNTPSIAKSTQEPNKIESQPIKNEEQLDNANNYTIVQEQEVKDKPVDQKPIQVNSQSQNTSDNKEEANIQKTEPIPNTQEEQTTQNNDQKPIDQEVDVKKEQISDPQSVVISHEEKNAQSPSNIAQIPENTPSQPEKRLSASSANDSQIFKLDFVQDDDRLSYQQANIAGLGNFSKGSQNTEKSEHSVSDTINLNISVNTIIEDEVTDQQHTSSRSTILSKKDSVLGNDILQQQASVNQFDRKSEEQIPQQNEQVSQKPQEQETTNQTISNALFSSKNENQISINESQIQPSKEQVKEENIANQETKPPIQKRKKVKSIMGSKMAKVSKQDANAELQDSLDIIF